MKARDSCAKPRQPAALQPTPTDDALPRRFADFATMPEALDYAARGARGLNFHDARGTLVRVYPLCRAARGRARRRPPADRARRQARATAIALIAETAPEFVALFFGALYAGAWPVPLPLPTSFGGRDSYIEQLAVQLEQRRSDASSSIPPELAGMAGAAAEAAGVEGMDWASFGADGAPRLRAARGRGRTTSPICNIRAARPASRTASPSPIAPCSATSPPTPTA